MSDSVGTTIALGLIKSVVCVYDVLSLPVYAIIQKPWAVTRASSEIKARQEDPNDPYSPWVRIGDPPQHMCFSSTSVADLFKRTCSKYTGRKSFGYREVFGEEDEVQPDGKKFKKQVLGEYQWFTYDEIDTRVENIARGFMANGVKPGDVVLILAETRLEWMLAAQAIFRLGATIATLYTTLGDDGIVHGINETAVTHLVTTHDVLGKLETLLPKIPSVKCIIYIEGPSTLSHPDSSLRDKTTDSSLRDKTTDSSLRDRVTLVPFKQLEEKGQRARNKFSPPGLDDPAVIMYTSGSTGIPKGVIITHRNVLATIGGFFAAANSLAEKSVYMAYLPLAHVLELAAETLFFSIGCAIGYSSPHTMTDKSTAIKKGQHGDAVLLKPTAMAAVPLVLDRIRKGVWDQMEGRGKFFRAFFQFLMDYKRFWTKKGFKTPILNAVICNKIRSMLGGEITHIVCGSAPLSPETHEFIRACLDVKLMQGYGLTETAAGASIMEITDLDTGRVGPPLHGIKIKLVDWEEGNYHVLDKPHPRGEIVVGGGCVTAGYYKNEALTTESFREEDGTRWFYTGDIGEIQSDGSIRIIDRKKDLVKLQYGEYISLGKVETELKSCPFVDNICIYGDSYHNYVIAIIAPQGKALENLAKTQGKGHLTREQLCRDPQVVATITKAIADHGRRAKLHKTEIPSKILVVSEEWSPDSGLVTAAMKIRRRNIEDHYKNDIDRLYGITSNGIHSKST